MVDTNALLKKIDEKGLKKGYLADKVGLSRQGLYLKMNNENEFTAAEIMALCSELGITKLSEKESIFFAKKVENNVNLEEVKI